MKNRSFIFKKFLYLALLTSCIRSATLHAMDSYPLRRISTERHTLKEKRSATHSFHSPFPGMAHPITAAAPFTPKKSDEVPEESGAPRKPDSFYHAAIPGIIRSAPPTLESTAAASEDPLKHTKEFIFSTIRKEIYTAMRDISNEKQIAIENKSLAIPFDPYMPRAAQYYSPKNGFYYIVFTPNAMVSGGGIIRARFSLSAKEYALYYTEFKNAIAKQTSSTKAKIARKGLSLEELQELTPNISGQLEKTHETGGADGTKTEDDYKLPFRLTCFNYIISLSEEECTEQCEIYRATRALSVSPH